MQYLNFLKPKRSFTKNIDSIQSLSTKIEKKLLTSNIQDVKVDKLTLEELNDINKILELTNFVLLKYNDRKETRLILEHFVSILKDSAQSIESVDDEILELVLSAEDSISKIKSMRSKISEKSDLEKSYLDDINDSKIGSINLTNFTTGINTSEYQQNSQERTVQMI